MKYLLDTNICIYLIKKQYPNILQTLVKKKPDEVGLSSITLSELEYGVHKSQHKEKNSRALELFLMPFQVLPFDATAAQQFGQIRALLESSGKIIGTFDMLIASHAISLKATLVTNNQKEFSRVPGLALENWVA